MAFAKDAPLARVAEDFALAKVLGVLGFVGVIVWLYGWMLRRSAVARLAALSTIAVIHQHRGHGFSERRWMDGGKAI